MEVGAGKKSMRKIGGLNKEGKGLVLVEMEGMDKKKDVMIAKSKLKREDFRVEDDITFEERRIRRIILQEAAKERAYSNSVKVGYMKMWVNGNMRLWDEVKGSWKIQQGNELVKRGGERGRKIRERDARGKECTYTICFWNIAGVKNKEEDFWAGLRKWDIVVLIETWANCKKWMEVREFWKKGFKWDIQEAVVPKGRGRARGGMLIGVKEGIEVGKKGKWDIEGWVEREVKLGEEWWWVVGVYINENLDRKKKLMSRW
ncbi:GSCOCG00010273001-RA-CDS, partial [Cotesia congregata]